MNSISCLSNNDVTPYVHKGYLLFNPGKEYAIILVNLENIKKETWQQLKYIDENREAESYIDCAIVNNDMRIVTMKKKLYKRDEKGMYDGNYIEQIKYYRIEAQKPEVEYKVQSHLIPSTLPRSVFNLDFYYIDKKDKTIHRYNLKTNENEIIYKTDKYRISYFSINNTGDKLIIGETNHIAIPEREDKGKYFGEIYLYDLTTKEKIHIDTGDYVGYSKEFDKLIYSKLFDDGIKVVVYDFKSKEYIKTNVTPLDYNFDYSMKYIIISDELMLYTTVMKGWKNWGDIPYREPSRDVFLYNYKEQKTIKQIKGLGLKPYFIEYISDIE